MLKVAIIGAGIGGLATALALSRQGIQVEIFERLPNTATAQKGAGIMLHSPGLRALAALGIKEQVVAQGVVIKALSATWYESSRPQFVHYPTDAIHALGIARPVLNQLLLAALQSTAATIRFEHDITEVNATLGLLQIKGQVFGPYEVIAAADGFRSATRATQMAHAITKHHLYSDGAVVCLVPHTVMRSKDILQQIYGPARHLAYWPVSDTLCAVAWTARPEEFDLSQHVWAKTLRPLSPALAEALSHDAPPLYAFRYGDIRLNSYLHERLVLLGDAAHAMSPHMGLGASLALCDAIGLASAFNSHNTIAEALRQFSRQAQARNATLHTLCHQVNESIQSQAWHHQHSRRLFLSGLMPKAISEATFKQVWSVIAKI